MSKRYARAVSHSFRSLSGGFFSSKNFRLVSLSNDNWVSLRGNRVVYELLLYRLEEKKF